MIRKISRAIYNGLQYSKNHPQILFVFIFVVVLPVLFLYSGQQFLEAGRLNQDRLQKDRVGLLQDTFVLLLEINNFNGVSLQDSINEIAALNPDITKFRITKRDEDAFIPVAALNDAVVGVPEAETDFYRAAGLRTDESLVFPFISNGERHWQVFRYVGNNGSSDWFIFSELSLAQVDAAMQTNEQRAYILLFPIIIIVMLLGYWQFRNTDYRYLYLEAEEANKTRDLFTNMITHELRAPLTAMKGYASMIEEDDTITAQQREYGKRIRLSSERLVSIVNDLLEVARIQSGRLHIDYTSVDVSRTIAAVIEELKPSADAKGITMSQSSADTNVVTIESDEKRLHQILINIVSNSIKYTPQGTIDIGVTSNNKQVEIRVKDTGMGISAEDQQKLFAPFSRVGGQSIEGITGTGLGMWITKQLIEHLNGSVGVESIKDVGTNIVMKFPKQQSGKA
ncbi:MAG: HAMP domain-containing sensor histidine kinase [Patescibacteria group bacterium]